MTHDDLSAQTLVDGLPPESRDAIKAYAVRKGLPLREVVKEAILFTAQRLLETNPPAKAA